MGAFPTERSTSLLDATTFSFDSDHFQLRMENRSFLFCFVLKCLNIQNHREELSILVLTCTSSPFPCPDSTKSSKNWFNPHPSWLIKSQPQSHTQASLESGNKMSSNTNHPSSGRVISKSGNILCHEPVYSLSLWHHLSAEGTSNTCSLLIHWVDMLASGIFYDTQGDISESWLSGNFFHSSLFRGRDTRDLFNYNGCQIKKESWKHQGRPSSSHMVWDSKRNSLPGILNESIGFFPEGK